MATVSPVVFLKEVRNELSRVTWPTKEETIRLTIVVIGVSLLVGLFIGGTDVIMTKVTDILIKGR